MASRERRVSWGQGAAGEGRRDERGFGIPDLGQHEVVDAAGVLLLHRLWVDEVAHVLVHHLRDEGREGSLGERGTGRAELSALFKTPTASPVALSPSLSNTHYSTSDSPSACTWRRAH